jgi:DNA polymerase zeta
VTGRPFYGYHSREHRFFKIFFYNPWMMKRAADMLQTGAILSQVGNIYKSVKLKS